MKSKILGFLNDSPYLFYDLPSGLDLRSQMNGTAFSIAKTRISGAVKVTYENNVFDFEFSESIGKWFPAQAH